jgi:hypothetical protein
MPYITPKDRCLYDDHIKLLVDKIKNVHNFKHVHPGHVNYVITKIINEIYPATSYQNINEAVGVVECVKQEYYRHKAVPYENDKMEQNGDV